MSSPLASVVIPVYNGARFLREAIESVLAQDYAPLEIIVIDDGSCDASAAIAQSFAGVRCVTQANQGNAAARNRGITLAQGEFIALLDQDDRWRPAKLRRQIEALQARAGAGYALCHGTLLLEPGVALPKAYNPAAYAQPFPAYLPSALVVRPEIFRRVGPFDPAFRAGNDSDWFFRALDLGVPLAMVPEVLLEKRVHADNQGHDVAAMRHDLMRVVRASVLRKRQSPPAT